MTGEHPSPWRNPLLWLIVGLPALAVVGGIAMLFVAGRTGGTSGFGVSASVSSSRGKETGTISSTSTRTSAPAINIESMQDTSAYTSQQKSSR